MAVIEATAPSDLAPSRTARPHLLLWALLAAVFAVWLAASVGEPYATGHHENNAYVWTSASASLRADPIGSRLGAVWQDGSSYVHHPPLIVFETAAAEVVFGVHRVAQRMPAWLGIVAAVWLMDRVLRRQHIGALARAAGCMLGFGIPMVFTFGTMIDTPVTSLPFGVLCLLSWQRARDGDAARWERPLTCALAVLAGWQAALLAVLTLVPRKGRTVEAVAGVAAGVLLLGAWVAAAGGIGSLVDVFAERTGAADSLEPMSPVQAVINQGDFLWYYLSPIAGLVAVAGLVVAVRSERHRTAALLLLGTTLGYPAVTTHALGHHHYWMFWIVLPVAFGTAVLADHEARTVDLGRLVGVAASLAVLLAATTL